MEERNDVNEKELAEMADVESREESLSKRDREMLENLHLHFGRGPGEPRSWEEMSEEARESIRRLYWNAMNGSTNGN